jgi:hypothetical protein
VWWSRLSQANDRERPRIFSQMKIPGNRVKE